MADADRESSRKEFLSEAEDILEEIGLDLRQLENSFRAGDGKPDHINKIFRSFHSLKGIAGMLGFESIAAFTHELETILDQLRLGKIVLDTQVLNVLFQSIDELQQMMRRTDAPFPEPDTPLLQSIRELLSKTAGDRQPDNFPELLLDELTRQALTEFEEHRLRENIGKDRNLFGIRLPLHHNRFDRDLRAIFDLLAEHGEVVSTLPSFEAEAAPDRMIFRLIFATAQSSAFLQQLLAEHDPSVSNLRKDQQPQVRDAPQPPMSQNDEASVRSISPTVRVDIQKLDEIIHVIGELLVTKAMITNISKDVAVGAHPAVREPLRHAAVQLEKRLNDLQRSVIDARLVPVAQIYNKLARMVRKLSADLNKQIEVRISGEGTRLDKLMIERLSDPLLHIVRNAIDHGIETPEERLRAGKSETGTIRMSAFQRGNNVVLQIEDDGRGIAMRKIAEKARRTGWIRPEEAPDQRRCLEFIFSPGFSSAENVTSLSGRGVGLDVVKRNISEMKGTIDVQTEEGKGTLFEISLPITLAILQALVVKVAGEIYAIPLTSVAEIVRVFANDIHTVDRKEVYRLREKTIPLLRVADLFRLPEAARREKVFVVVVEAGGQVVGLVVDELRGQHDIVIKSLGRKLENIPGIAGAAEIGESRPVLVLDAESMIDQAMQQSPRRAQQ